MKSLLYFCLLSSLACSKPAPSTQPISGVSPFAKIQDVQAKALLKDAIKAAGGLEHSNLTTPHIWWNYFDAETFEHVAYMVQHADHFIYVENLSTTRLDQILFPVERESWRVDKNRNKLWLRATYLYDYY